MPRRPARALLIALALGLLTTVLVSWLAMPLPPGNAWQGPPATEDIGLWAGSDGRTWQISRGDNAWHRVVTYWHMQISGLSLMMPDEDYRAREFDPARLPAHLRPESVDDLTIWATFHQTGWPLPALACSVRWKQQILNSNVIYTVRGGVQLPRDAAFNPRALPLTPLWPGILLNTLLFAALWLALGALASTTRARLRRARNRCPACNYPRAGLTPQTPCPECGHRPNPFEP